MVEVKFTSSIRSKKGDDASSHQLLSKNYKSLGENFQIGSNVLHSWNTYQIIFGKNFVKKVVTYENVEYTFVGYLSQIIRVFKITDGFKRSCKFKSSFRVQQPFFVIIIKK